MRKLLVLLLALTLGSVLQFDNYVQIEAAPAKKVQKRKPIKKAPVKKKVQHTHAAPRPVVTLNLGNGYGQPTVLRMKSRKVTYKKNGKRFTKTIVEPQKPLNATFDGIDVSRHQGTIYWNLMAKTTKLKYVYIKATEGENLKDIHYHTNLSHAKAEGFKVGSYLYFRPNVPAKLQFQNFISQVATHKQDLLPMIDIEEAGNLKKSDLVAAIKELLDLINEYYGQKPLLYTMRNFYNTYLTNEFMEYPLMIGAYSRYPTLADGKKFTIWQFSCEGKVDGIAGDVDLSVFNTGFNINDIWLDKMLTKDYINKRETSIVVKPEPELQIQTKLTEPEKKKKLKLPTKTKK